MNPPTKTKKTISVDCEVVQALTPEEQLRLNGYENDIEIGAEAVNAGFQMMAQAVYQIQKEKLYKVHGTLEGYFHARFGFGRSQSYRLADAGAWIEKMSPAGDILKEFKTESHFRPLVAIKEMPEKQNIVLKTLEKWRKFCTEVTPRMVESAALLANPPAAPPDAQVTSNKKAEEVLQLIKAAQMKLPPDADPSIKKIFKKLYDDSASAVIPHTTSIGWTRVTWNPLEGCSRASEGCKNCYAAKFYATRGKHKFPGLAKQRADGTYAFTGKIVLLPEKLSKPLTIKTGTKIFVNSMSDLFHKDVPWEFIDQVFEVMENASWHTFQVLTKRPEIMAKYTQKRYKDHEPPRNIWLGTSTENQDAYDKRIEHLQEVKARVRWISAEPLLGPIKLKNTSPIDWLVVGGESSSDRKMDVEWARSLRDQCKQFDISFFFKQWGDFGPNGQRLKKEKLSAEEDSEGIAKKSAKLDDEIHEEWPVVR